MQMVTFTRATGSTTEHMEEARTFTWTERSIRANGLKTSNMATESRRGLMVLVTKVLFNLEKSTVLVRSVGQITRCTSANFYPTTSTAKVSTCGPMDASTRATGRTTKCKVVAPLHGATAANTSVSTMKIKSRATENSSGQMGVRTRVNGLTANSTEKEFLYLKTVSKTLANGEMASATSGCNAIKCE